MEYPCNQINLVEDQSISCILLAIVSLHMKINKTLIRIAVALEKLAGIEPAAKN